MQDHNASTTLRVQRAEPSAKAVSDAVAEATDALIRRQQADGHWVFELEADATIPSEYLLLQDRKSVV